MPFLSEAKRRCLEDGKQNPSTSSREALGEQGSSPKVSTAQQGNKISIVANGNGKPAGKGDRETSNIPPLPDTVVRASHRVCLSWKRKCPWVHNVGNAGDTLLGQLCVRAPSKSCRQEPQIILCDAASSKGPSKAAAEDGSRKRSRLGDPALAITACVSPETKKRAAVKPSQIPMKQARKPKASGEESRLKRQKTETDAKFEQCCQHVIGSRVGVWWEDDHCFYKVCSDSWLMVVLCLHLEPAKTKEE